MDYTQALGFLDVLIFALLFIFDTKYQLTSRVFYSATQADFISTMSFRTNQLKPALPLLCMST